MIRQRRISSTIEIEDPNYMSNMEGILHNTVKNKYVGKLMSNYIILDAKVLHRGLSMPSLGKEVARADAMIQFDIVIVPNNVVLQKCVYQSTVSDDNNMDQTYHIFSFQNDEIPIDILNRVIIIVQNNGLTADSIKKLDSLAQGDIIPLFVIKSTPYPASGKLGCFAIPNFDDAYSPVFKFTQKMIDTGKFDVFSSGKLQPDKLYKIVKRKLVEEPKQVPVSNIIDFLDIEQLGDYIATLISL